MRYTAATCDPDDFTAANGWTLRQNEYGRGTELLIAVTSCKLVQPLACIADFRQRGQDPIRKDTTQRDAQHPRYLQYQGVSWLESDEKHELTLRSKFWRKTTEEGRPGWQRIVVTLIADGLGPMDTHVLDVLATLGVYQDGILKKAVDDKPTVAHIFEVSYSAC
jgi:chitin synthase